jgi:phosphate transport system substrate-binding protein
MKKVAILLALLLPAAAQVLVNGAGATFPYPIYARWFDEFHRIHPNAMINYQSVGSGFGIRQLKAGVLDLGASDMPLDDSEPALPPNGLLHFPTVVGGVVPIYNVPKLARELDFTPHMLAGIMLGQIKRWDDPRLKELAPGVQLPTAEIMVVHRSDGSGSTFIFSDYLSKTSPEWKSSMGKGTSLHWKVGIGARGNEGVAGIVKQTPFSMGYVELAYALQNRLTFGRVRNSAGKFIKADTASLMAAAASEKSMPDDFRISITNAPDKNAYPIASYTWLLTPARIPNPVKKRIIVDFLEWMVRYGQSMVGDLGYAPLPKPVAEKVLKACGRIQ